MQRINNNSSYLVAEPGSESNSSHIQPSIHLYNTDHTVSFWETKYEQKKQKIPISFLGIFVMYLKVTVICFKLKSENNASSLNGYNPTLSYLACLIQDI